MLTNDLMPKQKRDPKYNIRTDRSIATKQPMTMGRFMKKMDPQPKFSVKNPPITGPKDRKTWAKPA